MALYSYEAYSRDGKKVRGIIDAASAGTVKDQLVKQGLFPITIAAAHQQAALSLYQRLFGGVSEKDKILFTKQAAVLLKSGVPLLQTLELLVEQFSGYLRSIIIAIKDDIKGGSTLFNAMSKYSNVFDNVYLQLVRAGEASGKLELILERLTSYLERREEINKRVKDAMFMPVIQLVLAFGVIIILMWKVVPPMVEAAEGQGKPLPGITLFVKAASDFVQNYFLFIGIFIAVIWGALYLWKRTESGSLLWDRFLLRIPLVGYLSRMQAVVQFSYTLGLLLESGVNLSEALDIVCNIIDNRILAKALRQARDNIIKQGKIAQYLKQTNVFPPIAIYLIETGEESGQLDKMLLMVAGNYQGDVNELIDKLTALIGPITILFMAVIVGGIAMAVMLPIMQGM
jgi:type II secretory pathway component PulF